MRPILSTTKPNLDVRLLQWNNKYLQIEHELAMIINPVCWQAIPRFAGAQYESVVNQRRNQSLSEARSTLKGYWALLTDAWPSRMISQQARYRAWAPVLYYRKRHPELQVIYLELQGYLHDEFWHSPAYYQNFIWPPQKNPFYLDPGTHKGKVVGIATTRLEKGQPVTVMDFKVFDPDPPRHSETIHIFSTPFHEDGILTILGEASQEEHMTQTSPDIHTYMVEFVENEPGSRKYGYISYTTYQVGDYVLIDSPTTTSSHALCKVLECFYNTKMHYTKFIAGGADITYPAFAHLIKIYNERSERDRKASQRRAIERDLHEIQGAIQNRRKEVQRSLLNNALAVDGDYQRLNAQAEMLNQQLSELATSSSSL